MRFEARDGSVWDTVTGGRVTECVWAPHASLIANAMNRGFSIGFSEGHAEARGTFMGMVEELGMEAGGVKRRAGAGFLPAEGA